MKEEVQPRASTEGEKLPVSRVSCSSSHETSKHERPKEEEAFVASDSFCNTMCAMMSKPDIEKIGQLQLETLTRFQEMNTKFNNFNRYSFERYEQLNIHFQSHTRMIVDMKKDLDIIFRRIRNLKTKLARQYDNAFAVTSANIQKLEKKIEADHEDYKEEKPQTVQPKSPSSDHPQNTTSDDATSRDENPVYQQQTPSSSGAESASGPQTNDIRKEKQTVKKPLDLKEVQRPVLRPQLSSSDDNYCAEETDDTRKEKQMVDHDKSLFQEVQSPVLKQVNSSDDNNSAEENTDQDTQGVQNDTNPGKRDTLNLENSGSKVNYTTALRPEISSSDESLEDDTDDEREEESDTNAERWASTSPSSEEEATNTEMANNKDLHDGGGTES
ncbi:uncharacterized protein LOC116305413 [Actinia tenebrosa]|uniref:Uncharacterized protein LOC116305413 n=1 Tax=Actinia tenebrosa TaxID=6105 RepID=A0A6P8IVY7_ACTTE|nr:uncharacterized protein LOC116305413 [Actinia tenebrosa]